MIAKSTAPEGWSYEGPDPSVGIFGHLWMHDDCPQFNDEAMDSSVLEHMDEFHFEGEGMNQEVVTTWTLECSCGATVTVRDYDYYPDFPEE